MKKNIFSLFALTLITLISSAQKISFELKTLSPILQSTDVGDIEFVDIDNDGDNDLILTGKGGPVLSTLYKNDGEGNFTEIIESTIEDVYRSKIGLSDVDNDGDIDLLISGANSSPVLSSNLYLNDGNGNFELDKKTNFEPIEDADIAFGDIDNDGDDDVIMTGSDSAATPITKIYINDGKGFFSEKKTTHLEQVQYGAIELVDFNNDGNLDLILCGTDSKGNYFTGLYSNNGLGDFSLNSNSKVQNYSQGDIAVGDVDNDGDIDLLINGNLTKFTIKTELYTNDGLGNFTPLANTPFSDISLGEMSFKDLDNDNDLDVFLIGTGQGGLINNRIVGNVYENNGNNSFTLSDSLIGAYFASHAIADTDGDNLPDLILGGTTTSTPTRGTFMYTNTTRPPAPPAGTNAPQDIGDLKIYPNPSAGLITIELKNKTGITLAIYSEIGKLVYSKKLYDIDTQLNLKLSNGIYTAVIKGDAFNYSKKIIINQ